MARAPWAVLVLLALIATSYGFPADDAPGIIKKGVHPLLNQGSLNAGGKCVVHYLCSAWKRQYIISQVAPDAPDIPEIVLWARATMILMMYGTVKPCMGSTGCSHLHKPWQLDFSSDGKQAVAVGCSTVNMQACHVCHCKSCSVRNPPLSYNDRYNLDLAIAVSRCM
jgi:hypothetical protein